VKNRKGGIKRGKRKGTVTGDIRGARKGQGKWPGEKVKGKKGRIRQIRKGEGQKRKGRWNQREGEKGNKLLKC